MAFTKGIVGSRSLLRRDDLALVRGELEGAHFRVGGEYSAFCNRIFSRKEVVGYRFRVSEIRGAYRLDKLIEELRGKDLFGSS